MADDITLNLGAGGAVVATDDVSGRHYQAVKIAIGPEGDVDSLLRLVNKLDPLPTTSLDYTDAWNPWTVTTGASPISTTTPLTLRASSPPTGFLEVVFLKTIHLVNEHASVGTRVYVKDGSDNTLLTVFLPPSGGQILFPCSPLFFVGINEDIVITCVTTGATVSVNAQGYGLLFPE